MALNKNQLEDAVHAAFKKMQDAPLPADKSPAAVQAHMAQLLLDLAADLSNAIDAFVRSGDVTGVNSAGSINVQNVPSTVAVNVTQSGVAKLT